MTFRYADHDEVYERGDAFYAPSGHVMFMIAGTGVVEFSPSEEHARTKEALARNLVDYQGV